MIFLPHTEVYPRLKFHECALCFYPPDLRIPPFSYRIPCIFLLHTEGQVKVIFSEAAPCITPQDLWNPSFS